MRFTKGQIAYMVLALGALALYGLAQSGGWGSSGRKQRPLRKEQLRQSDLGYRSYVFWYHGYRGK